MTNNKEKLKSIKLILLAWFVLVIIMSIVKCC